MTSPTTIVRCALQVQSIAEQIPAQGGSGAINVTAARDCAWSASAEATWLSIKAGNNGQGDGAVEFAALPNPDPAPRQGAILANGQRAEITQAAADCVISLGESSASFGQAGGSGQIPVRASSGMCTWSAAADADWITIRTPSGRGTTSLSFDVAATTGPPRGSVITIANQKFAVTQAEGCAYTITPATHAAGAAGGGGAIGVATTPACPWTAASNVDWIKLAQAAGTGPASVSFSVAATAGPARTGSAVVAGHLFTVTQGQGCSYNVQPLSHSINASGGTATVTVSADSACAWTAAVDVPWITIQGPTSTSGDRTVALVVAATTGPARTGTATIAGRRVVVTQSPGCSIAIAPDSASVAAAGGTGKVTVTAGTGCAWSASSAVPWITISSGASGTGGGEVQYSVAATTGPARSGSMTIGGRTFTINQGLGCSYALSSGNATVGGAGGPGSFVVRTASGCAWTVSSAVPWIDITSAASATGEGTVRFTVDATSGPSRTGTITAGGQTFTVTQANGCTYAISPNSQSVPAGGGLGSVSVTAGSGCSWTAASNDSWLALTGGATGTGNGTVSFNAASHAGPTRTGTLTIAGHPFTVTQTESCTFSIAPDQSPADAAGGNLSVAVSSAGGCAWTAAAGVPWMRVTSGASGSGNGTVQLAVDANGGAARSGTATIAGRTYTVNQGSGCSYTINPGAQTVAAGAGSVPVSVTTSGACTWTAASNVPWLTVSSGTPGSGSGTVQVDVQANAGGPRSGTVTIAGQTFTANQESGCSYVVAPETLTATAAGGPSRVDVTAAASCTWSATSAASWITVTSPANGTGTAAVDLSVAANTGPSRAGTVTIAGRTVTVTQDTGCTFALSAASQTLPAAGGNGSVSVTAAAGCTWTATSNAPWITVTGGTPGSGSGAVQFTAAANPAPGTPRSGTILIAGQTFTVNQD